VPVSFVRVLNACAGVLALEEGGCAHEQIVESGLDLDGFVSNTLIDKHAKCGAWRTLSRVFTWMPSHNVVTCNSLILGHGKCGDRQEALKLF
jgi:hypothetical protein